MLVPNRVGKSRQGQAGFSEASGEVLTTIASEKDWHDVKIYVGNLPFSIDDDALAKLFTEYGQVESAKVINDRDSGRSRGFGFVEMSEAEDARKAIDAANGLEVDGRALNVNEAKPQKKRGGQQGGGNRGGRNRGW